jgi:hypothetical protein
MPQCKSKISIFAVSSAGRGKRGKAEMKEYVKVIETQQIVEVYFRHADSIAYVGEHGIEIIFHGQYEELPNGK